MGGRGRASRDTSTEERLSAEPVEQVVSYIVIGHDTPLGGAIYPFLEQTGRAWHILSRPLNAPNDTRPADTFGLAEPTLRWVSAEGVSDLYVDGMSTEEFLKATGLSLHLDKGAYVLSKRLSRLLRPHFLSGFFAAEEVTIRYLDSLDANGRKVWDGAGVVSRAMLRKMVLSQDMPPAKRAQLLREIDLARRVEFTLLTANGQDKGHAIVADDLDADFVLPRDTKGEVRLTNTTIFAGLTAVHGREEMRLDIQSLINLYPFFEENQLLEWLGQEGELFVQSIQEGTAAAMMGRIDEYVSLADVTGWHVREYLASGGHPLWFGSITKSLINQHLARLNRSTREKLRLPIPGGRLYVMPAAVGQAAGIENLSVPRGHIQLDPTYGTAWVNDEDWLALGDSPNPGRTGADGEGIAAILGGADNDDALWVHPFTDYDGTRRVLAWRSPNQVGEYVVLQPTAGSAPLPWQTAGGEAITYPAGDSRKLPPRIDQTSPQYLGLVAADSTGNLGQGQAYSPAVMAAAVERAQNNRGVLGMYCNSLMLHQAVFGRLPATPPAPLEQVIDGTVKTGADLGQVKNWTYEDTRNLLRKRMPIPQLLHGRLSAEPGQRQPQPIASQGHWLDRLEAGVKGHIGRIEAKRDELVKQCQPPRTVFDSALADPETITIGAGLNRVYSRAVKQLSQARPDKKLAPKEQEATRQAVESYLKSYPPARQAAILRGAMASLYLGEARGGDTAVWLPGATIEGGRNAGVAQLSIQALREIGVLDEIDQVGGKVLVYPNAAPEKSAYQTIGLQGVWFHQLRAEAEKAGRPAPTQMSDVPKEQAREAKQQVNAQVRTGLKDLRLHIREAEGRKAAYTPAGELFGYLSRDSEGIVAVGEWVKVRFGLARDGNVRVAVE
ncbi:MAG: hypothetical protein L0332_34250 [Chloroflexi bacterium]|nr:hypothetical protein [Chloroflexota bacterium]